MARSYLEDMEQKALIEWASMTRFDRSPDPHRCKISDYLFAIPNGGFRHKIEAARMKGLGVKAGVSDLFFPVPIGSYNGCWIEMKKPRSAFKSASEIKRAATSDQLSWQKLMRLAGYRAEICYGFEEARQVLSQYIASN